MAIVVMFVALGLAALAWLLGVHHLGAPKIPPFRPLDLLVHLTLMGIGALPLTMLSAAYAELVPLRLSLLYVVLPGYGLALLLGLVFRDLGRRALTGFVAGIVAVLVYDVVRLALGGSQGAADPIPHIGTLLFGSGSQWWIGYVWRILGNGAGLGMTFVMLCPRKYWGPVSGLAYGTLVGTMMLLFLYSFPKAQPHLFILSWAVVVNGYLGHWAYGATLGWGVKIKETRDGTRAQLHPPQVRRKDGQRAHPRHARRGGRHLR